MSRLILSLLLCLMLQQVLIAQNPVEPTPASSRFEAKEVRDQLLSDSWLQNINVQNIGPTVFSGRVVDIEVNPNDHTEFLVAYASGGLWHTSNNGTTFSPLFDHEEVITIGDFDVDWKNGTIWLGSGEVNASRSSYAGTGMYLSRDMGKTWVHKGLPESHHIGRVIIDRNNPDIITVADLGHLYSDNPERGIYQSTDGGNSWNKVLYINEKTGAIDLIEDPVADNIWYAAMWQRERRAWNFIEAGKGSGIYKSMDNGKTWKLLTTPSSGFPSGDGVGRIGLATTQDKRKTILYALLDNYNRRPEQEKAKEKDALSREDFKGISKKDFIKLDKEKINAYLKNNNFPEKYNADEVIDMVKMDKIKPTALAEYLEDANSLLFDTPVIGAEVYRSLDGGESWQKTNTDYIEGLYNSYGYYFGQIRAHPRDPDKVYIMGVPILKSTDGGKTWNNINKENVHVDHHALWINPDRDGHLINGNDGGINISYDDGENWIKNNSVPVGQFYYVNVDMQTPYKVYGGLQDNGVWVGPHDYQWSAKWHSSGQYPYRSILGGDGMQVQIDSRDNTVYTGFQFGNYFRIEDDKRTYITPKPELGQRPYRWNWQSPILLSKHNEDIVYFGAHKLLRSLDKGETFEEISDDLTNGGIKGDVPYGTITSIDESSHRFGLLYVGTDDGNLYRTDDGGFSWVDISKGLPDNLWVARVIASQHNEARVMVVMNGYRWDNFASYAFISEDYGKNWTSIAGNLPSEPLNVIKEDPKVESIVYVGSDHGLYISPDFGKTYMMLGNMPEVPVHDLVIHPRENDLIIATHGRSIFRVDIAPWQKLVNDGWQDTQLKIFSIAKERYREKWGSQRASYSEAFEPKKSITIFSAEEGKTKMTIMFGEEVIVRQKEIELKKGITDYHYDLSIDLDQQKAYQKALNAEKENESDKITFSETDTGKQYLHPGEYKVIIKRDQIESSTTLTID